MKNIIKVLIIFILVTSCTKVKKKKYLTFSGKIENPTCDSIIIKSFYKQKTKIIRLSEDGSFSDTLNVKKTYHGIYIGEFWEKVYFQNGDNINMSVDINNYSKTLNFSGKGVEKIHFMKEYQNTLRVLHEDKDIHNLSENKFKNVLNNDFLELTQSLLKNNALDSSFIVLQKKEIAYIKKNIEKTYKEKVYAKNILGKGKASPKFVNYINYKGNSTSLDDLKGKYIYIDFWDTWCKPCIAEFPTLEKLVEKYNNKNIQFVSIALMTEDLNAWKTYVTEKNLKGTQLLITKDKSFKEAYKVSSIPRYILIDPKGNIIDADAPRPSDPKLIELFNSLEI